MNKIYNMHAQSQEKKTKYNPAFSKSLFQLDNFTNKEQLVIGALMTYRDLKRVFPSQKTLAEQAQVSPRTVYTTIAKLRALNLIETHQRMNASLVYYFSPALLQGMRPFLSALFFSLNLLFVPSTAALVNNCELKRNTECFNSSSSLKENKLTLAREMITKLSHRGDQKMKQLLKEAQRHVSLTQADLELLDTLPDAAIQKSLKRIKNSQHIENKAAYFMKVAQYEAGSMVQDVTHLLTTSDNEYDVKSYVNKKLPLESGYKTLKNQEKIPLERDATKSVFSREGYSTNQSQENKSPIIPIYESPRYALVDPVLYAEDAVNNVYSKMTEEQIKNFKMFMGAHIPDAPYKLPFIEKNFHVFKKDSHGNFIFA